jgi:Na+/melibiose symporter-like transporter
MKSDMENIDSSIYKEHRYIDYIKITVFGFAISALWNTMGSIITPLIVLGLVADAQKNTYLGILTFAGLVLAMVVQPVAGMISDRSSYKLGRRRPYILVGTIFTVLFLMSLSWAGSIAAVLIVYCLLQISSNTAHGPWQGFIPDLVQDKKRGLASGVKGVLEILGTIVGIQLIGYFMSERFVGNSNVQLPIALGILAFLMIVTMLITIFTVREEAGIARKREPLLRLLRQTFYIDVTANPGFITFLISRFLFLMPLIVLRTFGLYILRDFIDVADPVAVIADLMVVLGICLLVAVYPAGRLSDRIGRRPIVIISGLIGALGFAVIFFFRSYIGIMFAGGLLGIANGAFMSANWAMATDLVPEGEEGRYLGLTNLATAGAVAVANITGPIIDFLNSYSNQLGYQAIIIVCIILLIISSILQIRIKQ